MARKHEEALKILRERAHRPGGDRNLRLAAQIRRIENDWELETCSSIEAMALQETIPVDFDDLVLPDWDANGEATRVA